jgi:hypothetical protein
LTTFGLRKEAVFGYELVVEDHRLRYIAVSKTEDDNKKHISLRLKEEGKKHHDWLDHSGPAEAGPRGFVPAIQSEEGSLRSATEKIQRRGDRKRKRW